MSTKLNVITICAAVLATYLVLMYFVALSNAVSNSEDCADEKGTWQANPAAIGAAGRCIPKPGVTR